MARWPKPSATGLSECCRAHPPMGIVTTTAAMSRLCARGRGDRGCPGRHRGGAACRRAGVPARSCQRRSADEDARTLQRARRVAPKDDSQVTEQQGERGADINEHEFHKSPFLGSLTAGQSSNCQPRGQPSDEVRHLRIQGDGTHAFGGIAKSETPPPAGGDGRSLTPA